MFIMLHTLLGLQEAAIMGGCSSDVISPPESIELCIDEGLWNIKHCCFITHILDSVDREVEINMDTIDWVLNIPIGQTIDQQFKIVEKWIKHPCTQLWVGWIVSRVKSH
jgi:hypothetical protein